MSIFYLHPTGEELPSHDESLRHALAIHEERARELEILAKLVGGEALSIPNQYPNPREVANREDVA